MKDPIPLPILAATLVALSTTAMATPHRAVWFWNKTTIDDVVSPHSSSIVVGDAAKEANAIAFMTCHGVKEVYGSYSTRPADEVNPNGAAAIRTWNDKLQTAGIESQLLISGPDPDNPAPLTDPNHTSWVNKVLTRLVNFNNLSPGTAQMFDALHLDLEPQTLDDWTDPSTTATDRRAYLDDLLDAYVDIRAALDGAGFVTMPIYVDIPWNWEKMPLPDPADGKVGWTSVTDRDSWYAAVGAVVDGMSVMTFTAVKDTLPEIAAATAYERTGPFGKPVRVGIQPKVGPGKIWPTYPDFTAIVNGLETEPEVSYGTADLENYVFWRHSYADYGPSINPCLPWISAVMDPQIFKPDNGGGPVVIFTGTPGYLYQIKHSEDLGGNWTPGEVLRVSGEERERMSVPVPSNDKRGFWVIEESDGLPAPR